jgi:arginine utilization protein RocB
MYCAYVLCMYCAYLLCTGMGIKGGIARKLLKEKVGRPEPPGSFDVDVLLFIDHYTVRKRDHCAHTAKFYMTTAYTVKYNTRTEAPARCGQRVGELSKHEKHSLDVCVCLFMCVCVCVSSERHASRGS